MAENFAILQKLQIINPALAERLTKAVGFRNIAVHTYQSINWNVVYQICKHHLEDFRQLAKAVNHHLQGKSHQTIPGETSSTFLTTRLLYSSQYRRPVVSS